MQWFCFVLFVAGTILETSSSPVESTGSTVRCYDCHYDPTGLKQKDDEDFAGTGNGGFPRCALRNDDDQDFLNKYGCTKGKCFIRRDPNGQVFRGCADPWNLPWGIDSSNNCKQQNDKSFWWFCEGELCNDGTINDEKRCENIPKVNKEEKEKTYHKEQSYTHEEQNVYQPSYHQADYGSEHKEPSASISVTPEHDNKDHNQDSLPVSVRESDTAIPPMETVYGNEYSDPKAWYDMYLSKFSNDPNTKPHYHEDSADFVDSHSDGSNSNAVTFENNDNVYYSRTQGRYVSYGNDGPAHYYTDSELSYNTDGNYNTYDYILPDDYGRTTEYHSDVEHTDYTQEPYYPELYKPADDATLPVPEYYHSDDTETNYKESDTIGGVTVEEDGYFNDAGTYYGYNEESDKERKPATVESHASYIPQDWYYQEQAELAAHHFPYGWHPYFFPWLYGHYSYRAIPETYKQEVGYSSSSHEAPKKSHEPLPSKSHYEPQKKSHPQPPKKSHYEPPKKSHPQSPKKSHNEPPKRSHPQPSKKFPYEPPKKSRPQPPKKSHYEPPKKSHAPPPKKSHYEPPQKSHPPPPKNSHYEPPKKSYDPPSRKSHYELPKKSNDPPSRKSHYELPKKSHLPQPKKSHFESPKRSHPEPLKKSSDPSPKKSHPSPNKSQEPEPKKSYAKSDPAHKGKYQPPAKSQPAGKEASSPKKIFEPDDASVTRDENTVYSLGDNLQVLGTTLIHVDDPDQDGINVFDEIDQANGDNFAREYDDGGLVYYEYEYEDDDIDDSTIGTGDLYDPNSLKDDTAYYYEYSHKLPVPSEAVQSLCSQTCGLYPHPDNNKQFVQCGPGVHYGQSCDCCHAYEHSSVNIEYQPG